MVPSAFVTEKLAAGHSEPVNPSVGKSTLFKAWKSDPRLLAPYGPFTVPSGPQPKGEL